uniref:Retrotransposon gag domain-containing protein n=1 Tax=Chromera velia CCMP2878 TaxID=1169474 RepID=A0A0G4IG71_9ALVE|eukprot:Cvel_129.t1-p1 / transcript=Cvel_129.t1 / gene=Cvel_129 / organism=Chromera_velia_CCMP2878 / gene_product=hypothetical protein / transcript_product=hypothetical protein / location=Cvel_scaffold9:94476-96613(-) / protein_length=248 / sequence_SO=supercontig / SO=protein_coding / is_pseudo=false
MSSLHSKCWGDYVDSDLQRGKSVVKCLVPECKQDMRWCLGDHCEYAFHVTGSGGSLQGGVHETSHLLTLRNCAVKTRLRRLNTGAPITCPRRSTTQSPHRRGAAQTTLVLPGSTFLTPCTIKADTFTFSGERNKANEFWSTFKADCVAHKWDLNLRLAVYYFRKAMRGTALTWWTSEMEEKVKTPKTIENLHACIEAQFGITEAEKDAAEDFLDNLVQDVPVGETIYEYAERVAACGSTMLSGTCEQE